MEKKSFNSGWAAGPAETIMAVFLGGYAPLTSVTLPHDSVRDLERTPDAVDAWNTGFYPDGTFTYEKTFAVPAEWADEHVELEFEGVYRDAVVRLNGDLIAHNRNGYTGFTVDLSPFLRYSEDNSVSVTSRAHEDSRWYSGSGIYRDTWLHRGGLTHVVPNEVRVSTPQIEDALVVAEAEIPVRNTGRATRTVRVRTRVLDAAGSEVTTATAPVTVLPGETQIARLRHYILDPRFWSIDSPELYSLAIQLEHDDEVVDRTDTTFGIRSLQLDPLHGLRINGKVVKLRGACVHHDNGILGSATISRAEERRVERLKAAGYNALRSAHNPMSRAMLDACDRIGMVVMDEFSDVWTEPKTLSDYSLAFPDWWERDIEAMVVKDFNHPSVVMYSIGNEILEVGRPLGARWGRLMAEKVRAIDNTRYVTNAVNYLLAMPEKMEEADVGQVGDLNAALATQRELVSELTASPPASARTEESFSVLDISGVNYGEVRYELDRELFPNRVLVGSETFPEHLDVLWPLVENNPHVIGDFAWTGWDYLGEAGLGRTAYVGDTNSPTDAYAPYPYLTSNCGTIDIIGERRPISYWREIVWGLRSEPYIAVQRPADYGRTAVNGSWAWPDAVSSWSWDAPEGARVMVEVYSPDEEIELLLNGQRVGQARVGEGKSNIALFDVLFEPGELVAIAYRNGQETARTSLRTATGDLRLAVGVDRTEIQGDGNDLAYISIVLEDTAGNLASHADRAVHVEVEGSGVLAGLGSARHDTTERFDATTTTTYDGRALAIIRPTHAGEVTVRISTDGAPPVTATIKALPTPES